jgi:hypothetical protein
MTENTAGKQKMRLGTLKYLKNPQKNQYRARTGLKLPAVIAEKRNMRLGRRENTINDLKNEPASKTGVVFHVMVTEAIFSLKNSGTVHIKMHFLQNESLDSTFSPTSVSSPLPGEDYDEGVF